MLERASRLFQRVTVAVALATTKSPLFSADQRVAFVKANTGHLKNVEVVSFDGLLVDFARQQGAKAVLRGIRAISDYEYEFQMAMMNRKLDPELETLFMLPAEKYTYVSSRLIKGVFRLGGDVTSLVPPLVMERLRAKVPPAEAAGTAAQP